MIIKGKEGIAAQVIADSISPAGVRLTTLEIEYPRFILAEVNTHRALSKNSASSRAIPVNKILDQIEKNPAMPVFWGKNQSGMQAVEELTPLGIDAAKLNWREAAHDAIQHSRHLGVIGLHKQITNRITEPWQMMKTVITGTEWNNFFWLRNHDAAQPEFHELARVMGLAMDISKPRMLTYGEWHLPYVEDEDLSWEDALKVSASCCAQVSYRKLDDSFDKAIDIYNKLVGMDRAHASPFEHQATPHAASWEEGVTHQTRDGTFWSNNLRGWIQHRALIPNNVKN